MDLTKRIEGTRQLGSEFLTWLMYRSLDQDGIFETQLGKMEVWFEDKLTLVSPFAGSEMNILKGESPAQGQEAVVAIRQGKHIDEAKLSISHQNRRFDFVFNGPKWQFSGVKVPAVVTDTEFEAIIDRFDLMATLEEIMRHLYHEFLKLRLEEDAWQTECRAMERWFTR